MRLKYKVVLTLFASSLVLGFGGYAADFIYAMVAGLALFILSFSTLIFSNKDDRSVLSILADGVFFSLV